MRAIGRDKWDKLKEQFKDNLESMLIEFLSNGPGMMDFKVFNGVYGIIKSPLSDSFSRDVYEFYTSQKSFAEAYRVLVRAFGTSNNNMANTLDIMASRIAAAKDVDSTDREIVTTFISAVKLVVAIIYNNNLRPKLKKAFENSTNNPKIYESLVAFYNGIEDISDNKRNSSGELNFIGLKEVAGKIYPNTVAAKNLNGINAIAALFLIISTAISKGKMEMEYDLSEAEDTYDNKNTSLDVSSIMYDNLVDEIFSDIVGTKKIDIIDDPTLGQTPYQLKVIAGQLQLKDINGKSIFITGRVEWNKAVQAVARERSRNDFSYKFVRKLLELVDESTEPKQKRIEFVALLLHVSIENDKFIEDNRK